MITLGWSDFAKNYSVEGSGNSFSTLTEYDVVQRVLEHWDKAKPGHGETNLDRKVVVPVPPEDFYCPPWAKLVMGMPVTAEIVQRQKGEDPYIKTYVTQETADEYGAIQFEPAQVAEVVCYSADALTENDGKRSTDCDWEIVTILCTSGKVEPMLPLTMARNQLELPGGTKSEYTPEEFADAIYYYATRQGIRVQANQRRNDGSRQNMDSPISFSVVGRKDARFPITFRHSRKDDRVKLSCIPIDVQKQQLGELGGLFLCLADNGDFDHDSVYELLTGYGASNHHTHILAQNLRKLADSLDGN